MESEGINIEALTMHLQRAPCLQAAQVLSHLRVQCHDLIHDVDYGTIAVKVGKATAQGDGTDVPQYLESSRLQPRVGSRRPDGQGYPQHRSPEPV